MANRRWVGRAGAVPQVTELTPAVISVGSTFTVAINRKAVTFTATTTVVADAVAGVVAACGASTYEEFAELTWTDSTTVVTVTGPDDGADFTLTLTAGGTGSPTFNQSTTTSPTGPNWFTEDDNWEEQDDPDSTDDVYVDAGPSILYGLDKNAVTLASLRVGPNFPADASIGLPPTNERGYPEYRTQRLKVGATVVVVDTQSRRIRLDLDTDQTALTVLDTGQRYEGEVAALDVLGTHASSTANVMKGDVAFAGLAGETAQFSAVRVSYRGERSGDARVVLGAGLTLATLEQTAGRVEMYGAITTVTKEGGDLVRQGTGAVTTFVNRGGRVDDAGTGTITALTNGGVWERDGLAGVTYTDATLLGGGTTRDPAGVVTWTNAPQFHQCSPYGGADAEQDPARVHTFDFGSHRKITIADV